MGWGMGIGEWNDVRMPRAIIDDSREHIGKQKTPSVAFKKSSREPQHTLMFLLVRRRDGAPRCPQV